MLVSIVATTFNHEQYISQAVQSIFDQTYGDIELILVDDGSAYNIEEKLLKHRKRNIKIIRLQGEGTSYAINAGISYSKGDYIALFSGDDISKPNRIEEQLKTLNGKNNILLFDLPNIIDSDGSPRAKNTCPYFLRSKGCNSSKEQVRSLFYEGNYLCAPTAFSKRETFDKIGTFHQGLLQLQDFDYWIRALKNDVLLEVKETNLIDYRFRSDDSNLSGRRATSKADTEFQYILKDFIFGFRPDLLCDAFYSETFFHFSDKSEIVKMNWPIWFICHPNPAIRRIGYEELIKVSEQPLKKKIYDQVGLSNPNLSKIIGAW